MKNSLFSLVFLTFGSFAFAANWSIQNLDTGKTSQDPQVHFCQEDWYRLAQGNNCISGDVQQAFNDLQIQDGCDSHVTKVSYSSEGIRFNVHGPVCIKWEPHPEPNCLQYATRDVPADFKVCDSKEKFYSEGASAVVPFQEEVKVINSPEQVGNVYYSGDVQITLYRREGYLSLRLNSFKDKLELRIALNPDTVLPEKGKVDLTVLSNQIMDANNYWGTSCEANIQGASYALICTNSQSYMLVPALPLWTLGKGAFGNSIAPYPMEQSHFALQNVKTKKILQKNVDYTSLGELWFQLADNKYSNYCVRGDLNQAANTLKDYTGPAYGLRESQFSGKVQVLPQGIQVFLNKKVCPENLVQEGPDVYGCPVPEVDEVDSLILKACR